MDTAGPPRVLTASSKTSSRRSGRHGGLLAPVLLMPAGLLYCLFVLWPLVQVLWLGLQQWSGYGPQRFIGLANFGALAQDAVFRQGLSHTVLWMLAAAGGVTAVSLALALLVWRLPQPALALAILFFPALLPGTVVAAVWTLVLTPLHGLINAALRAAGLGVLAGDWLGDPHLALPALFMAWAWSALGIATLLLWSALRAIGREYLDLALAEGAGPLQRFRLVLLPGMRRAIGLAMVIEAALALAVFDLVYVTTGGGPGNATMLLSVDMYGRAFGGLAGQGAAVATIQLALGALLATFSLLLLRRPADGMDGDPQGAQRRSPLSLALLWPALILVLLPFAWLLVVALGGGDFSLAPSGPTLDPRSWGGGAITTVWNTGMGSALATSLLLAVAATGLTLLCSVPAAFALARLSWPPGVRPVLLVVLVLGLFQPTPVLIIPLFSLLKSLGLLDSALGILLPEVARTLPLATLLLWAWMAGLPTEVLQAAAVDGASPLQQLLHVVVPLSRPAVFAAGIWAFISSWNEYLLPTVVSQDGSLQTAPTLLATFLGRFDTQYNLLSAGSLLALAPSLLIYLALRRPAAAGLAPSGRRVQ